MSTDRPPRLAFRPWGRRSNGNNCKRKWRVMCKAGVLAGELPRPELFLSTVWILRRPWLIPLPAEPQEPKCHPAQDKAQNLLWKHSSFLIGSWADKPLPQKLIFMQRVFGRNHCPHTVPSRMELGLTFQLLNPKQKSNVKSPSAGRKPLRNRCTIFRSISISASFGMDSQIKPSKSVEERENQLHYL